MIIGVSGKIKSGKNEFVKQLYTYCALNGIKIMEHSFAKNLKRMSFILFGLEWGSIDDRIFKEEYYVNIKTFKVYHVNDVDVNNEIIYGLDDINRLNNDVKSLGSDFVNDNRYIIIRLWYQFFGTDMCRSIFPNIWVASALNSCKNNIINIFTDVRFSNEMDAINDCGGVTIRIERDICNGRDNEHISETALDSYNNFKYVIENNGTLEEFRESVYKVFDSIKNKKA